MSEAATRSRAVRYLSWIGLGFGLAWLSIHLSRGIYTRNVPREFNVTPRELTFLICLWGLLMGIMSISRYIVSLPRFRNSLLSTDGWSVEDSKQFGRAAGIEFIVPLIISEVVQNFYWRWSLMGASVLIGAYITAAIMNLQRRRTAAVQAAQ
jgi:hypothetical protein